METPFEKRMKFLKDEQSDEHMELQQRLKKTLYYGRIKNMDCQSLAMTELAVEYLQELVPKELGKIDMYWASSLSRDVSVTPCALMLALMYLKRLKHNSQYLAQVSSSDLFLISVLVASKYLYDEGESDDVSNIQWACLTKTDVEDINENEQAFLHALDWKIFVKPEDFWNFLQNLEEKVAWKMGLKRNSFTYTDLSVIVSVSQMYPVLYNTLLEICKVFVICLTAYVGCITTLCASNAVPAVVFSRILSPLPSQVCVIPSINENSLSPVHLFRSIHRVPGLSFINAVSDKSQTIFISNLDIPHVCEPWGPSWNARFCIHASACLTIALIQELATSSYKIMLEALLSCISFATYIAKDITDNLFGLNYGFCFRDCLSQSNQCNKQSAGDPSNIHLSNPFTYNSSTCSLRPSRKCKKNAKVTEMKSVRHQIPSPCSDGFGSLCQNNFSKDPSFNNTMTFPSVSMLPNYLAQSLWLKI